MRYSFPALLAAADHCKSAAGQVSGTHDELKGRVQTMAASWDGDAQGEYLKRQKQWDDATTDMVSLLGQIERALRASAESMQGREKANAAKFAV
jgi:WXG100 family type VII secretion target